MNSEPDEPALFDLPLAPPASSPAPPEGDEAAGRRPRHHRSAERRGGESLPLFGPDELGEDEESPAPPRRASYESLPPGEASDRPARPRAVPSPRARPAEEVGEPSAAALDGAGTAPLATRLRAGLGDLVVLAAVGAGAALGARSLGGALTAREFPALLAFLLAFSFLYCVVSLAFWGQTPGMAWSGLVARTDETEPLSFGQTALRWLGHWLTWALAGLPGLLAISGLGGRSLADRLSGSSTYELEAR